MCMTTEKYCVVPGGKPVRLESLSGHICQIGEEPRPILQIFELEAKGRGCITEAELEGLKARFAAMAPSASSKTGNDDPAPGLPLPNTNSPSTLEKERFDKIVSAVIELVNAGEPSSFDKNGKPTVKAVAEKCGFEISGPERDAAFDTASK